MKTNFKLFVSVLSLVILTSCSSDSEDDLTGTDDTPGDGVVTYTANIRPILNSNCVGCHGSPTTNGAPFSLTTFNQVSSRASGIINAVSKQTGEAGAMPPSGRMPQANIDLIQQWIDDGTPEN